MLGAAPGPLQTLIDKVRFKQDQGVVVTLAGLPVIFGTADRADEKWTAVAATLSDPKLDAPLLPRRPRARAPGRRRRR